MASTESSIEALKARLHRLEYILTGSTESNAANDKVDPIGANVTAQINSLNASLIRLGNQNQSVKRLLQVCDSQPSLLEDLEKQDETSSPLSQSEKLAIIMPSASAYHQTMSSLLAIQDTPFPDESVSAECANHLPEVAKLQMDLAERSEEFQELAVRSAAVLQGYYELVDSFNGCLVEWDERLREMETIVCRREKAEQEVEVY